MDCLERRDCVPACWQLFHLNSLHNVKVNLHEYLDEKYQRMNETLFWSSQYAGDRFNCRICLTHFEALSSVDGQYADADSLCWTRWFRAPTRVFGLRWRPRLAQWCHLANDDESHFDDQANSVARSLKLSNVDICYFLDGRPSEKADRCEPVSVRRFGP